MRIVVFTLTAFAVALLGHLIWWRVRVPRRQLPALVNCFSLIFLAASVVGFVMVSDYGEARLPRLLHAGLFYWALACTYVITYSSYLEVDSPTLTLMRALGQHPNGLVSGKVEELIASRPFLTARLEALKRDGLVIEHDGRLRRSGKRALLFQMFQVWGRLLHVAVRNG